MKKIILGGCFALAVTGSALSAFAFDPAESRKLAMANIGFGASQAVPMIKGGKPFDAAIANLTLRMTQSAALAMQGAFPEGSDSKGASPDIWTNKADFDAKVEAFIVDANAAVAAKPQDLDAFKVVYGKLLKSCSDCHRSYRVKN